MNLNFVHRIFRSYSVVLIFSVKNITLFFGGVFITFLKIAIENAPLMC